MLCSHLQQTTNNIDWRFTLVINEGNMKEWTARVLLEAYNHFFSPQFCFMRNLHLFAAEGATQLRELKIWAKGSRSPRTTYLTGLTLYCWKEFRQLGGLCSWAKFQPEWTNRESVMPSNIDICGGDWCFFVCEDQDHTRIGATDKASIFASIYRAAWWGAFDVFGRA